MFVKQVRVVSSPSLERVGEFGNSRLDGLVQDRPLGALLATLSLLPAIHALCHLSAPFCPPLGQAPNSVLSPVPKLPIQFQALPPQDSETSSDSDYEHYDFSTQPPVALTTFYSECLGPGSPGRGPGRLGTFSRFHPVTA